MHLRRNWVDLEFYVGKFREDISKEHRYYSYDICRRYFNAKKNKTKTEKDVERSCVYLSAYLSSWGMYRGSTEILWKSPYCLKYVVGFIFDRRNTDLWSLDLDDYGKDGTIERLCHCVKELKRRLIKGSIMRPSDTLVTKIMLGVWACSPAFDNYFNAGIQKYFGKGFQSASVENKYRKLNDFLTPDNLKKLVKIRGARKEKLAKILDECFFQAGSMMRY